MPTNARADIIALLAPAQNNCVCREHTRTRPDREAARSVWRDIIVTELSARLSTILSTLVPKVNLVTLVTMEFGRYTEISLSSVCLADCLAANSVYK